MLGRTLDDSFPLEVRRNITVLTVARTFANAAYRFSAPFLATVARGLDASLTQVGVALTIAELSGLLSPATARLVDRLGHRRGMVLGLVGVAIGCALAALSPGWIAFAVAVVVLSQSKVCFDLGMGSWTAHHVPYQRRSAVIGLTETSWAFGLLIGVSLMGVTVAIFGWPSPYVLAGVAIAAMAVVLWRRIEPGAGATAVVPRSERPPRVPLDGRARWVIGGALALMASTQCLFVTFGSWLQDDHGFSDAALAGVTFALGFGELAASLTSARNTDRWGKERSAMFGALVMVPSALLLATGTLPLPLGITFVIVAVVGFEFAIVSVLAAGTTLIPASPARGLALLITAGTFGRALFTWPATRAYESHGFTWPAAMTAGLASVAAIAMARAWRAQRRVPAEAQR